MWGHTECPQRLQLLVQLQRRVQLHGNWHGRLYARFSTSSHYPHKDVAGLNLDRNRLAVRIAHILCRHNDCRADEVRVVTALDGVLIVDEPAHDGHAGWQLSPLDDHPSDLHLWRSRHIRRPECACRRIERSGKVSLEYPHRRRGCRSRRRHGRGTSRPATTARWHHDHERQHCQRPDHTEVKPPYHVHEHLLHLPTLHCKVRPYNNTWFLSRNKRAKRAMYPLYHPTCLSVK